MDDEHHMLFDCEAFAHLRTEPFAPREGRTIRDFAGTTEFYWCVPIMMDYVDQEQAARVERRRAEQPPQAEGLVT